MMDEIKLIYLKTEHYRQVDVKMYKTELGPTYAICEKPYNFCFVDTNYTVLLEKCKRSIDFFHSANFERDGI